MFVFLFPLVLKEIDRSWGYLVPDTDLPEELMDQFRRFDIDGDGQISPTEFVELLSEVSLVFTCLCVCVCVCVLVRMYEGVCMCVCVQLPAQNVEGSQWTAFQFTDEHLTRGVEAVTIRAQLTPLNTSTMSIFSSETPKVSHHETITWFHLTSLSPANGQENARTVSMDRASSVTQGLCCTQL